MRKIATLEYGAIKVEIERYSDDTTKVVVTSHSNIVFIEQDKYRGVIDALRYAGSFSAPGAWLVPHSGFGPGVEVRNVGELTHLRDLSMTVRMTRPFATQLARIIDTLVQIERHDRDLEV
jgi:hypothetical protein